MSVWRRNLKSQERKFCLADISYAIRFIKSSKKDNSKSILCFLENILLRRCDYVSKLTSNSSYMTNVASHMQFFIKKCGALMTPNVLLRYFVPE